MMLSCKHNNYYESFQSFITDGKKYIQTIEQRTSYPLRNEQTIPIKSLCATRKIEEEILADLELPDTRNILITGNSGYGKSVTLLHLYEHLKGTTLSPLVINGDTIDLSLSNTFSLQRRLLELTQEDKPYVVLIDNIDQLISRHHFKNVFDEHLLHALNNSSVKLIFFCREEEAKNINTITFQHYHNIPRLTLDELTDIIARYRSLASNKKHPVTDQLRSSIQTQLTRNNQQLFNLLSTPLHLRMALNITPASNLSILENKNKYDLFEMFYTYQVQQDHVTNRDFSEQPEITITAKEREYFTEKLSWKIFLSNQKAIPVAGTIRNAQLPLCQKLTSQGILTNDHDKLSIFHDQVFEWLISRSLLHMFNTNPEQAKYIIKNMLDNQLDTTRRSVLEHLYAQGNKFARNMLYAIFSEKAHLKKYFHLFLHWAIQYNTKIPQEIIFQYIGNNVGQKLIQMPQENEPLNLDYPNMDPLHGFTHMSEGQNHFGYGTMELTIHRKTNPINAEYLESHYISSSETLGWEICDEIYKKLIYLNASIAESRTYGEPFIDLLIVKPKLRLLLDPLALVNDLINFKQRNPQPSPASIRILDQYLENEFGHLFYLGAIYSITVFLNLDESTPEQKTTIAHKLRSLLISLEKDPSNTGHITAEYSKYAEIQYKKAQEILGQAEEAKKKIDVLWKNFNDSRGLINTQEEEILGTLGWTKYGDKRAEKLIIHNNPRIICHPYLAKKLHERGSTQTSYIAEPENFLPYLTKLTAYPEIESRFIEYSKEAEQTALALTGALFSPKKSSLKKHSLLFTYLNQPKFNTAFLHYILASYECGYTVKNISLLNTLVKTFTEAFAISEVSPLYALAILELINKEKESTIEFVNNLYSINPQSAERLGFSYLIAPKENISTKNNSFIEYIEQFIFAKIQPATYTKDFILKRIISLYYQHNIQKKPFLSTGAYIAFSSACIQHGHEPAFINDLCILFATSVEQTETIIHTCLKRMQQYDFTHSFSIQNALQDLSYILKDKLVNVLNKDDIDPGLKNLLNTFKIWLDQQETSFTIDTPLLMGSEENTLLRHKLSNLNHQLTDKEILLHLTNNHRLTIALYNFVDRWNETEPLNNYCASNATALYQLAQKHQAELEPLNQALAQLTNYKTETLQQLLAIMINSNKQKLPSIEILIKYLNSL